MAHKKAGGSSKNGRDSNAQRLGCKAFDGQFVTGGSILVRQRGTKFHPGQFVGIASDDTLYAEVDGVVTYKQGGAKNRRYIHIIPAELVEA